MRTGIRLFAISLLFVLGTTNAFATTWDEPWADQVIKESDYFVLADILSYDENSLRIKIIKQLGGESLPAEIEITGFYLLKLTSVSGGHGPEFRFRNIENSYFFIKKNEKGEYCIATPTAGFDFVRDSSVYATYRHSYHQALVPVDVYEMTMTAVFNNYHQLPYDKQQITDYIDTQLSRKPAGFNEEEISTFFLQHIALELLFHLRPGGFLDKTIPFFNDASNFHHRVSAARALIAYNTNQTQQLLFKKIANNSDDDFTTVICIWTLKAFKPTALKKVLKPLIAKASTNEDGFGGNIMDPRVGTHFPSPKSALEDLVATL